MSYDAPNEPGWNCCHYLLLRGSTPELDALQLSDAVSGCSDQLCRSGDPGAYQSWEGTSLRRVLLDTCQPPADGLRAYVIAGGELARSRLRLTLVGELGEEGGQLLDPRCRVCCDLRWLAATRPGR